MSKYIITKILTDTTFATFLCIFFIFASCSKEDVATTGKFNQGSAIINLSVGSITEEPEEEVLRSTIQPEAVEVQFNDDFTIEATLERVPASQTRAAVALPTGTYFRLIAYSGSIAPANYVADEVLKVGSENDSKLQMPPGTYIFVAYSYNSTTSISDGFNSASSTTIPGTLAPPTDVLYFKKSVTLVNGENALAINFKHVFSQVEITLNAPNLGSGTTITASAAQLTTGRSATVALSTGTAVATTPNVTQNISWPSTSFGASTATSNKQIVFTNATVPTLTFSTNAISLKNGAVTVKNPAAMNFVFTKPLLAGYTYKLTCNIKYLIRVITLAGTNYTIASYSTTGASQVINASTNFGPSGTVQIDGFTYINDVYFTNAENLKWLTGTGNNGRIADIIFFAYGYGIPTGANITTVVNQLDAYMKKGGVVIGCFDGASGGYSTNFAAALCSKITGVTVTSSTINSGAGVYKFTAPGTDPIMAGPFGSLIDSYWGEDSSVTVGVLGLPTSNVTVYSDGENYSPSQTANKSYATIFKYESSDYNFVYIGDGGFIAAYASPSTYTNIAPFRWNTGNLTPIVSPTIYGGDAATRRSISNSIAFCNIMAWAVQKSMSLKETRDSYITP